MFGRTAGAGSSAKASGERGAEEGRYNKTCGSSLRGLGRVTDPAKGR
jgi:hypothetical protein